MNADVIVELIILLPIILGSGVVLWGGRLLWLASKSMNWPRSEGRVISSQVECRYGGRTGIWYVATVRYRYDINGRHYESERWSHGNDNAFHDEGDATQLANRFRQGDPIDVYVDPADPERAVLDTGDTEKGAWMVGGGAIFVTFFVKLVHTLLATIFLGHGL